MIEESEFMYLTSNSEGGAIHIEGAHNLTLIYSKFIHNQAPNGGAI